MSAIERFPQIPSNQVKLSERSLRKSPFSSSLTSTRRPSRDPRPAGALTLEDLERLAPPRDRELILSLA